MSLDPCSKLKGYSKYETYSIIIRVYSSLKMGVLQYQITNWYGLHLLFQEWMMINYPSYSLASFGQVLAGANCKCAYYCLMK